MSGWRAAGIQKEGSFKEVARVVVLDAGEVRYMPELFVQSLMAQAQLEAQ